MRGFYLVALMLILSTAVQTPARFTYSLSTTELVAGIINDVNITLINKDPSTATSISVRLSSSTPGIAVLTPPIMFKEIKSGQEISFHVRIAVSRSAYGAIAALVMQITYQDIYGTIVFTDTFTLGFRVSKISKLEVVGVERRGEDIIIKLRNIGPVPIHNVTLSVIADNSIVGMPPSTN